MASRKEKANRRAGQRLRRLLERERELWADGMQKTLPEKGVVVSNKESQHRNQFPMASALTGGNPDLGRCPGAWLTMKAEIASQKPSSFPDASQPIGPRTRNFVLLNAFPIITDLEGEHVRFHTEYDLNPRRLGMAHHIGYKLLGNAKQRGGLTLMEGDLVCLRGNHHMARKMGSRFKVFA